MSEELEMLRELIGQHDSYQFVRCPECDTAQEVHGRVTDLRAILARLELAERVCESVIAHDEALDELENVVLPTLASHHERIAALEGGKQQPEAPEWRVFMDGRGPFCIVCKDGWEVVLRLSNWGWETPNTPLPASCFERDWYPELHGPEKDAIVTAYLKWARK